MATATNTINPSLQSPNVAVRRIRAIIAAADDLTAGSIARLLRSSGPVDIVGVTSSATATAEMARTLAADLVVLDVDIPHADAFHSATQIKMLAPRAKVLLVAEDDDVELGLAALDAGADGFVCKRHLPRQCAARLASMFFATKPSRRPARQ